MGQLIRGPWKGPNLKELLERAERQLLRLVEEYRAEKARKKGEGA